MSEVPYRHPAFGDPPRRRRPGDPPLPKVRKPLSPESFKRAERARVAAPPPMPRRPIEDELREVLEALSEAPRLTPELPRLGRVLSEAEARHYAYARCLEQRPAPERSIWQWRITPAGLQWLTKNRR